MSSTLLFCSFLTLAGASLLLTPVQESAKQQLPVPVHINAEAVFKEKGCTYCHGEQAAGTERGPSLLSAGLQWKREAMEQQIREGGGAMPAFGDVLSEAELQGLLDYLALKKAPLKRQTRKRAGHSCGTLV
jgi:mono/diheme cytochrome c family protein